MIGSRFRLQEKSRAALHNISRFLRTLSAVAADLVRTRGQAAAVRKAS